MGPPVGLQAPDSSCSACALLISEPQNRDVTFYWLQSRTSVNIIKYMCVHTCLASSTTKCASLSPILCPFVKHRSEPWVSFPIRTLKRCSFKRPNALKDLLIMEPSFSRSPVAPVCPASRNAPQIKCIHPARPESSGQGSKTSRFLEEPVGL